MTLDLIEHTAEFEMNAPRERVWKALTGETSIWWHPGFLNPRGALAFRIDARLGGHAYEDWGDGQGLVWYTVTSLAHGEMIQLTGDMDLHYGPSRIQTTFRLKDQGKKTLLALEESVYGRVTEKSKQSLVAGWRILLEGCLKVYVETGAPPETWPKM